MYLHYVFDLWVHQWRKRHARGEVIIVRFADDFTVGFQYREDAERFLEELRERFQRFHLELHPEKTRLMEFGRYAAENRKRRGEGKPESFDFLGFTHSFRVVQSYAPRQRNSATAIVGRSGFDVLRLSTQPKTLKLGYLLDRSRGMFGPVARSG